MTFQSFQIEITPTEKGKNFAGVLYLKMSDIIRYFNPEEYKKLGYMKAVSQTDDVLVIAPKGLTEVRKWVSKTNVSFFDNPWLDTSSITMENLA